MRRIVLALLILAAFLTTNLLAPRHEFAHQAEQWGTSHGGAQAILTNSDCAICNGTMVQPSAPQIIVRVAYFEHYETLEALRVSQGPQLAPVFFASPRAPPQA